MATTKAKKPQVKKRKAAPQKKGDVDAASTRIKKAAMIIALKRTLGIVSAACKMVQITRPTHYNWLDNDAEYKSQVNDISEDAIDFAEGKLLDRINRGDTVATIFYLKTKGKNRGFVERIETEDKTPPVPIIIDWGANSSNG